MAIVGGTASEIGGGKFANGACGSAFQYLFNGMMTKEQFIKENGWSQDPNAKALENSLGSNAENRYGKDAPVAKGVFGITPGGDLFGKAIALSVSALESGINSVTSAIYIAGSITGAEIAAESYYGFDVIKFKKYIRKFTLIIIDSIGFMFFLFRALNSENVVGLGTGLFFATIALGLIIYEFRQK